MKSSVELREITPNEAAYSWCEQLYMQSFPRAERRDEQEERQLAETESRFHFYLITQEGESAGLLTEWEFANFRFFEHFAVSPALRGRHIGAAALEAAHALSSKPVILEVERPDTELAQRRIGFYKRNGYALWFADYLQPPFHKGDAPLPLYLMCHGALSEEKDFTRIQEILYKKVYKVSAQDLKR